MIKGVSEDSKIINSFKGPVKFSSRETVLFFFFLHIRLLLRYTVKVAYQICVEKVVFIFNVSLHTTGTKFETASLEWELLFSKYRCEFCVSSPQPFRRD